MERECYSKNTNYANGYANCIRKIDVLLYDFSKYGDLLFITHMITTDTYIDFNCIYRHGDIPSKSVYKIINYFYE